MNQQPTKIYEGIITADSTPLAFRIAQSMAEENERFSSLPNDEKSMQALADHLVLHNRMLLRAVGELELRMNLHAGKVLTSGPISGTIEVDGSQS